MIHLILLSGGSGSRLWPLSNSARSKQFLKVLRDEGGNHVSMVQRVFKQIGRVAADLDITIATSANQENSIRAQVDGEFSLVLEPERRDTAPAIMLACSHLKSVQGACADDSVIVMPIDTFADQEYYNQIIRLDEVVQSGVSELVLLGVSPSEASSKFGYIVPEEKCSQCEGESSGVKLTGKPFARVSRFVEKPDLNLASKLIAQGALWNCGVFAFKLGYLMDVTAKYRDPGDFAGMVSHYRDLPKISFDYEVVEKARSIVVVPYAGAWKDLGTWNTLTEEMADWSHGRAVVSDVENVHIVNETGLPMVVAGLKDAVVVATHDGILACSKVASSNIKSQVESISETRPMYERRRWGEYRVLDSRIYDNGHNALTKELIIDTGKQLSYQRHAHRSEVWTVVKGEGEVVLDGHVTPVVVGSVIHVHPMQMHAVRSLDDLHIIEVQLGAPLIEEDIERFGNYWD